MSDKSDKEQKGQAEAVDAFATVTAVGLAVASRTMEMWFGAMSGFARASREILAPHMEAQLKEEAAPPAPKREPAKDAGVVDFPIAKKAKPSAPVKAKAETSASAKRAPKAIERPAAVDDLKQITGVGPKLEEVLNGFGVWTYAQIADLQAEELAWLDDILGLNGRIATDKWLEQAQALGQAQMGKRDVAAG